jgi:hypothetical protein
MLAATRAFSCGSDRVVPFQGDSDQAIMRMKWDHLAPLVGLDSFPGMRRPAGPRRNSHRVKRPPDRQSCSPAWISCTTSNRVWRFSADIVYCIMWVMLRMCRPFPLPMR